MAWFNNTEETPQPVTGERLHKVVTDHFGFQVNADDDGQKFYCYVNGVPIRFDGGALPFAYFINAALFETKLPEEKYQEAVEWVTAANAKTHFVNGYIERSGDDGGVMLGCDATVVAEAGLTDEQLQETCDHALTSVLLYSKEFVTNFGMEIEGLTDTDDES